MRESEILLAAAALSFAALACEGKPQRPVVAPDAADARPTAAAPAPTEAGARGAPPGPGVAPAPRTGPATAEAVPPPALQARAGGERDHGEHDSDGKDDHDRDHDADHDHDHDRDRDHEADHHRDRDHGSDRSATPTPTGSPAPPAAARSPHARVGPDKCKVCHRVEHQSWSASAHAKQGIDCESCHGNGGDYWTAAVMRDDARAAAAGLVIPGVAKCRGCHANATPALLKRAHAHGAH